MQGLHYTRWHHHRHAQILPISVKDYGQANTAHILMKPEQPTAGSSSTAMGMSFPVAVVAFGMSVAMIAILATGAEAFKAPKRQPLTSSSFALAVRPPVNFELLFAAQSMS